MTDSTIEYQNTVFETMLEVIQKLPAEQRRQDPYGKEETLPARHPAVSIRRKTPPGDNTVDVGMIHKALSPSVQNTDGPYPCTKMFGVIR